MILLYLYGLRFPKGDADFGRPDIFFCPAEVFVSTLSLIDSPDTAL